jgi:predicted enzyme related to lactoylglutathione lyase
MHRFFQAYLRTTDAPAARAFYAAVLGEDAPVTVFPLHEQALARGARPHWLGFLEVDDVERAIAAFTARGATQLGPKWVNAAGLEAATVRDPGGAILALAKPPVSTRDSRTTASAGPRILWYLLHTADVERAKTNYRELFGWEFKEPLVLNPHGTFHPFAWEAGGPAVGSMTDVADRAGVHPHWLFHFRVADLDRAAAAVRAGGGLVLEPVTLPSGDRLAVCDDAQGAAFTLRQRA